MRRYLLLLVVFLPFIAMAQNEAEPLETVYQKKAFELFSQVAKDDPDNMCFSPLSVQMVMSMVQNGASGNTLSQMQEALGTAGYSNDEVNAFNQKLEETITYRPPFNYNPNNSKSEEQQRKDYDTAHPICEMANGIWARPGTTWHEQFLQIMRDCYKAGIGSVDFTTHEGIDEINKWVSDKTHGMIPKIFDEPQSSDLAMLLADALYFKGSWSTPFDHNQTKLGTFYNTGGIGIQTYMMRVQDYLRTGKTGNFLTLQLYYGKGDFSMTIFLPTEGFTLPDLTYDEWKQAFDNKDDLTYTDLRMPSFEVEDKYDLKKALIRMGMADAFDEENADFSNMRDDVLWVEKAYQCSKITVDEIGTEAAAVTVVEMYDGGPSDLPVKFNVDRPFYYTIENRKTGSVLFVGRVTQLPGMAISEDDIHLSCPDDNHPHMIDLGLPSGTKWACCNVGADKPVGYGGYYAWGETEEKDVYNFNTYIHCDGSMETLHNIGKDIGGTEYDVAHVKWGGNWQMPSLTQQEELLYSCLSIWTTVNDINGCLFISKKNGNCIFLPAAGCKTGNEIQFVGYGGGYWSSTHYPYYQYYAYALGFNDRDGVRNYNEFLDKGRIVRPVCLEQQKNDSIINFKDTNVKKVCIAHWDADNDGELSMSEAASVTDLGIFFSGNRLIKSFHELRYFTGLSTIAEAAFYDCSNLRELTFPNQLKSIGERAFGKCTNLYFDSFPKSITEIGRIAFYNCFALTSLEIPDAVTHIGNQAFYRCKGAKSVKIGKGVSIIPYNAFANCEGLKTVTIPCTVDTVGSRAFEGCISLSSVIIEDGESELVFMPERDTRNTFENCPLQNLYIGRSINISSGLSPFKNNTKLTTLTIGEKVGIIDERNGYAFKGCKNLLTVCVKSVNPPIVKEGSFERYDAVLMVPAGASSTYKAAPVWKKFTNICEFDTDGIQNISKEHNFSSAIYDIQGRRLKGVPQKGIYIQNGKKYVK